MAKPTHRAIADLVGTTPATVSRVLSNSPGPGNRLRQEVLVAARQLGYTGTPAGVVGLIIPDRHNPFFSGLGMLFQDALDGLGLQVVIGSSDGRPEREQRLVDRFRGVGLHGVIYVSAGSPSPTTLAALEQSNVPTVAFDRVVVAKNADLVSVKSSEGVRRAVDYLAACGHQSIGYIKGLDGTATAADREKGFVEAMELNRLEIRSGWVWNGDYQVGAGRACAAEILDARRPPTAVLAANDAMAIGLMQRLLEAGWSLPDQLSICGFDNIDACRWVSPTLTTVDQRLAVQVDLAVDLLTARIRAVSASPTASPEPTHLEVAPFLVPRASVSHVQERASAGHAAVPPPVT